jgi:hypothetical protein
MNGRKISLIGDDSGDRVEGNGEGHERNDDKLGRNSKEY